jgi:hypothetical protein
MSSSGPGRPPITRVAGAAGAGIGRPRGSAPPAGGHLDDRAVDAHHDPGTAGHSGRGRVSGPDGRRRRPARALGGSVSKGCRSGRRPRSVPLRRRRRSSCRWRGRGTWEPTRQQAPPTPNAAVAATSLPPGKAGEALALRLAVEVGHPLACQLASPVGHKHHGLLSLGSAGTVTCPTLGSGPPADITQKGSTWWKTPEAGAGQGGTAATARRRWTRSTTSIDGRTDPGRVDGG